MRTILVPVLLVWLCGGFVRTDTTIENIANVEFRLDERVFAVMCAAHAAGYDYGLETEPADSIRRRVAVELASAPVPDELRDMLRDFYRLRNVEMDAFAQQTKYASYALLLEPPPRFGLRLGERQLPPAVKALIGFEQLLPAYYRAARLDALWARHRIEVVQRLKSFREQIKGSVIAVLAYGRMPARLYLSRRLIVIPDAVNAPGILNAVHMEGTYYILASPVDDPARYQRFFVHEYLHYLLDPVLEPAAARFNADPGLRRVLTEQRRPAGLLEEPFRAVTESLINAAEIEVLAGLGQDVAALRQEMIDRDSPFLPYFAARLAEFRGGEAVLTDYVAGMMPGVDLAALAGAAVPPSSPAAPVPAAPPPALAEPGPGAARAAALEEAGRLIQAGRLDEAEAALAPVLAADPADAGALFGLGQVRFARKDYAAALGHFDRVLARPDLPVWIRGWSLVRSGYCLLHLERPGEADTRLREAAALTGDDRGAAAAARRALEQAGQGTKNE